MAGLPRAVTTSAGLISLVALFLFVPTGTLYAVVLERRRGAILKQGSSALAIRRRWMYALSGGYAALIGLLLVAPMTHTTIEIRLAGVVLLVWGLICISVAVLAFRMKPWLADPHRIR